MLFKGRMEWGGELIEDATAQEKFHPQSNPIIGMVLQGGMHIHVDIQE